MRLIPTMLPLAWVLACRLPGMAAPAPPPSSPRPDPQHSPRVVIIVADTAAWDDYTSTAAPFIRGWLGECALGFMNARVAGAQTAAAAYLSLGAGSRASARLETELAELALNYDELCDGVPAYEVFRARTGGRLAPGAVAYLGLPSVRIENADAPYPLRLGLLGTALSDAGLQAAAIGNADLPHQLRRQIVTLVMNDTGTAALGDVGARMYVPAPRYEPPLVTDYAALLGALRRALASATVVAVETGDLSRIAARSAVMTPERALEERAAALRRLDGFMRTVVEMARGRPWRLYLLAPSALPDPERRFDVLTPIVAWGQGVSRGWLTSPSTRRPGIVANTDLAPSVLEFLGLPTPPEAVGRPMVVRPAPAGGAVEQVARRELEEERMEESRPYVLKRVTTLMAVALGLVAAVLMLGGPAPRGLSVALREAALVIVALPLAALVMPGGATAYPGVALIGVVAITAMVYLAGRALGRRVPPWAWLMGAFTVVLCADVVAGQRLVQRSLLGYSAVVGARYYGLGNELGGVLLAAAPLAAAGWLNRDRPGGSRRLAALAVLGLIVVIIGHPALGANFGIAVPAALGLALVALGLYRPRLRLRHLVMAAGFAAVAALVVAGANWLTEPQWRSHIGQAIGAVGKGGAPEALMIVSRKVAFNWLLARHTTATWVVISALPVMAATTLGRNRAVAEQARPGSPLSAGLTGAGAAAAVSFFTNDSGVLAAAWGLAMVAATMAYVALDWRLRQEAVRFD
jgi:hypothetical protein